MCREPNENISSSLLFSDCGPEVLRESVTFYLIFRGINNSQELLTEETRDFQVENNKLRSEDITDVIRMHINVFQHNVTGSRHAFKSKIG